MSQNSLVLATSGLPGLTLIQGVNGAHDSLAKFFAGPGAPTAPGLGLVSLAGLCWHDTANGVLKVRDQADTAWIAVGMFDEDGKTFTPVLDLDPTLAANSDKEVPSQKAVKSYVDVHAGAPTGAVLWFARSSAPLDWLECDGALIGRTAYAALFAILGTTFGAGDGSTTFALPDLRGEFLRGWDHGRGVDSGRALGSSQTDAAKVPTLRGYNSTTGGSVPTIATGASPYSLGVSATGASFNDLTAAFLNNGTETRPRNVALMPCIKY